MYATNDALHGPSWIQTSHGTQVPLSSVPWCGSWKMLELWRLSSLNQRTFTFWWYVQYWSYNQFHQWGFSSLMVNFPISCLITKYLLVASQTAADLSNRQGSPELERTTKTSWGPKQSHKVPQTIHIVILVNPHCPHHYWRLIHKIA